MDGFLMRNVANFLENNINEGLFVPLFQPIYFKNINNPYGLDVTFKWMDNRSVEDTFLSLSEFGLSSLFFKMFIKKIVAVIDDLPKSVRYIKINITINDFLRSSFINDIIPLLKICRENYLFLAIALTVNRRSPNDMKNIFLLMKNIEKCKNLGVKIFVNNYGKNFCIEEDVIKIIMPDALKLSCNLLVNYESDEFIRAFFERVMLLKHTYKFDLIVNDIIDVTDFYLMKDIGLSYFQGDLFGCPDNLENIFLTY